MSGVEIVLQRLRYELRIHELRRQSNLRLRLQWTANLPVPLNRGGREDRNPATVGSAPFTAIAMSAFRKMVCRRFATTSSAIRYNCKENRACNQMAIVTPKRSLHSHCAPIFARSQPV